MRLMKQISSDAIGIKKISVYKISASTPSSFTFLQKKFTDLAIKLNEITGLTWNDQRWERGHRSGQHAATQVEMRHR